MQKERAKSTNSVGPPPTRERGRARERKRAWYVQNEANSVPKEVKYVPDEVYWGCVNVCCTNRRILFHFAADMWPALFSLRTSWCLRMFP